MKKWEIKNYTLQNPAMCNFIILDSLDHLDFLEYLAYLDHLESLFLHFPILPFYQ